MIASALKLVGSIISHFYLKFNYIVAPLYVIIIAYNLAHYINSIKDNKISDALEIIFFNQVFYATQIVILPNWILQATFFGIPCIIMSIIIKDTFAVYNTFLNLIIVCLLIYAIRRVNIELYYKAEINSNQLGHWKKFF